MSPLSSRKSLFAHLRQHFPVLILLFRIKLNKKRRYIWISVSELRPPFVKNFLSRTVQLTLCAAVLFSCADDSREPLDIPSAYDGSTFEANASAEIALVNQLTALTDEAKKGRAGAIVSASALENLYTTGTPGLKSASTAYFAARMEGTSGIMNQLALSSGGTYSPGAPSGNGGVWAGYLFDENGLELEQLLEKGNFGAVLFNHALSVRNSTLTPATADRLLAVFGARPAFSNSGSTNVAAAVRDRAMANYAARRDKNDGSGFYSILKASFIELQAALKAGSSYNRERDAALDRIFETWEKVNAATIINYCHAVISTMSATAPTDVQKAAALHAYAECVGFLHGFKGLPSSGRTITDEKIDALLTLLLAPANGTPTSYRFITEPATTLPNLQQVIAELKTVYEFSDTQIEEFRTNWVSAQNR
jgi:hypothetical protein